MVDQQAKMKQELFSQDVRDPAVRPKMAEMKSEKEERQKPIRPSKAYGGSNWDKFESQNLPKEFQLQGREIELSFRLSTNQVVSGVFEILSNLAKIVKFDCVEDGLQLFGIDTNQAVLMDFKLTIGTLKEYYCYDYSGKIKVNLLVTDFLSCLKLVNSESDLYFRKLKNENSLQCRFIDGSVDANYSGWFDLPLCAEEAATPGIPRGGDFVGQFRMGSSRFKKAIDQSAIMGSETLNIFASPGKLVISSICDKGGSELIFKNSEKNLTITGPIDAEKVYINVPEKKREGFQTSFHLKYFQTFSKAASISTYVDARWSTVGPFSCAFHIGESSAGGYLTFFIAAKTTMDHEEDDGF